VHPVTHLTTSGIRFINHRIIVPSYQLSVFEPSFHYLIYSFQLTAADYLHTSFISIRSSESLPRSPLYSNYFVRRKPLDLIQPYHSASNSAISSIYYLIQRSFSPVQLSISSTDRYAPKLVSWFLFEDHPREETQHKSSFSGFGISSIHFSSLRHLIHSFLITPMLSRSISHHLRHVNISRPEFQQRGTVSIDQSETDKQVSVGFGTFVYPAVS
jgi:hypothetical protein